MTKILCTLIFLTISRSAFAFDWQHAFYVTSQGAIVVGHVVDTATTQRCIGAGQCHEANPYLARFDNPVAFGLAKGAIGGGQLYFTDKMPNKWLAGTVNFAISGFFIGVGLHNYRAVNR